MKKIPLYVLAVILFSCSRQPDYPLGHFPEKVTSYPEVNSRYDDYNSDLNVVGEHWELQFSSNRYSSGKQFDLVTFSGEYRWDQEKGEFYIGIKPPSNSSRTYSPMIDTINSPANELGPYSRAFFLDDGYKNLTLYATDKSGNFDLKFVYPQTVITTRADEPIPAHSPQGISYVNTAANELYPSFYPDNSPSSDDNIRKMFYCSDKSGNFDIYEVDFGEGGKIVSVLTSKVLFESTQVSFNSAAEDKCPYFHNNVLVFASNRAGGYGGFDLYYALYENGSFSEAVNFGEGINTEADEYRPILKSHSAFNNELIIFSSNRPGGKGGFDLYYSGVNIDRDE